MAESSMYHERDRVVVSCCLDEPSMAFETGFVLGTSQSSSIPVEVCVVRIHDTKVKSTTWYAVSRVELISRKQRQFHG